jgi:hypothetical protein
MGKHVVDMVSVGAFRGQGWVIFGRGRGSLKVHRVGSLRVEQVLKKMTELCWLGSWRLVMMSVTLGMTVTFISSARSRGEDLEKGSEGA